MITKTGIHVDESSSFINPQIYEENGEVNHVVADNLTPSTRYYTRAYVVSDGTTIYSGNIKSFETLAGVHYFTIINEYAGQNDITLTKNGSPTNISLEYTVDNGSNWISYNSSVGNLTVTLNQGQNVKFRGNNNSFSSSTSNYYNFSSSNDVTLNGNIMTLVNSAGTSRTIPNNYCFYKLFFQMTKLDIRNFTMPATTLKTCCYRNMFSGCTSLTTAPNLPATTLTMDCYRGMFSGCTSLVNAPSLASTSLADGCYNGMFSGCTSLTTAPNLPATNVSIDNEYGWMFYGCTSLVVPPTISATSFGDSSCYHMFDGCTSLLSVPTLHATSIGTDCYNGMFQDCTSLTTIPANYLPIMTLKSGCYTSMFLGCTSLITAPDLPATTLATNCYRGMFDGCTSLVNAPDLPATTLVSGCYYDMFGECNSLRKITVNITTWDDSVQGPCYAWVYHVAATGDFYNLGGATISRGMSGIPTGWTEHIPDLDYMYIENTYNGSNALTLTTEINGSPSSSYYSNTVQYSKDKTNWTTLNLTTSSPQTINMNAGEKVYFRNNNGKWNYYSGSDSVYVRNYFNCSQSHVTGGNINSLLDYTNMDNLSLSIWGCLFQVFFRNYTLTSAQDLKLPSTTLCNYCYTSLFFDNTSLTIAPNFPALQLAPYCYYLTFRGCSSLTTAPVLPATTLAVNSYQQMFYGCTSLVNAPSLASTSLADGCYNGMFYGCSSLNRIETYANNINATNCLTSWTNGVAATGDFYNLGSATYPSGVNGIPTGWTVHTSL